MPDACTSSAVGEFLLAGQRNRADAEAHRAREKVAGAAGGRNKSLVLATAHETVKPNVETIKEPASQRRAGRPLSRPANCASRALPERRGARRAARGRAALGLCRSVTAHAHAQALSLTGRPSVPPSSIQGGVVHHPSNQLTERKACVGREFRHKRRLGHPRLSVDFENHHLAGTTPGRSS